MKIGPLSFENDLSVNVRKLVTVKLEVVKA